ncbi:MAG: MFS transporter [Thermodesulfobacteriota bacterium]
MATTKEKFAWCLYDFANSSYTTIIVSIVYSVYFKEVVAADTNGTRLWTWGYSGSMLIVAVISPLLGAIADFARLKKFFLILFSYICIAATALLYFINKGDIVSGLLIFAVSNIAFNAAMTFYNSFLPDLTDKSSMGRLSGYAWALGYIGGLICLALISPFISGEAASSKASFHLVFPITALFFLITSIPTFIILKERDGKNKKMNYFKEGFGRVRVTFHEIRRFKELTRYFIAYFIYTDAINTIIILTAIFAKVVLSFTMKDLVLYFIIVQISAALGGAIFGQITDRIGAKRTILITLVIWTAVVIAAYMVRTGFEFYIIGFVAGVAIGSNQSSSRTLLAQMTPRAKSAEFFGFFSLVGKAAAVIGPILYGEIATRSGSHRLAVLSLSVFFIVGFILLLSVNEKAGIEASEDYKNSG